MISFKDVQYELTEHIRMPERNAAPEGIEERRLAVYRELFFNNVKGFVDSAFPVLQTLYTDEQWLGLVKEFFANHNCQSPIFLDISKEFVDFLTEEYEATESDPVFLKDLAHYEWVELAVSAANDTDVEWLAVAPQQDTPLKVSPTAKVVSYPFKVHQISSDYQPQAADEQHTFLAVYRDRQDEVRFLELNPMSAQLLLLLAENPGVSSDALATAIHEMAPQFSIEQLQQGAMDVMAQLAQRGIICRGQ
ncbi:DUF2063 domain-containing protein [Corallincola platygyrae]|uniref:DUF2063 domain-containing protein n=1 Tax=Corallincola platygyrae TaxID=1193278 RepID=A0ABW4XRA4_9GAMM